MKTFFLTFAMSLISIFTFGQNYDKLWNEVEQYEDDGKPKSAYAAAEKILKKAQRKDKGQALCARLKMAALHQEWAPDSFFTDILEIEAQRTAEKTAAGKAVYASLLAELYEANRSRSQAHDLELTSDDMREWTREQYDSAAVANWRMSMSDLPALAAAKSKDWLPFIEQQEQSAYFNHDLLHVLWNRAKEQNNNVWAGTKYMLAEMAKSIVGEYKRLGNREAALLMSLEWIDLQSLESDKKLYEGLIEEYGDLPLCAEAYMALIDEIYDKEKRVALAKECIERYPKYERIGAVRNKLNSLVSPTIDWQGRRYYYPGKTYDWTLSSQNVQRVTFEILRMSKNFDRYLLSGNVNQHIEQIRKLGQPVATFSQDLEAENPWSYRKDTIHWKALEPGNYAMIITGETTEQETMNKTSHDYTCFICSRLQPIMQNGLGKYRTIVVDAETGHPIEGALVEHYRMDDDDLRVSLGTKTTDAEGRVVFDKDEGDKQNFRLYRKVTYGDDIYLESQDAYFSKGEESNDYRTQKTIRLYSDRSIYRPGQAVYIGGILYSRQHWDAEVIAEEEVLLILRDANNKEVETKTVVSDDMGKISADFMLPQGGMPGNYTLTARSQSCTNSLNLRVEEYKRPTFEVTMDKAPDMQWPADSITLTGKAIGYNGVPIREGRVTGTYQFTYPWWWNRRQDSERMPIDTVETDEDGVFKVRIPLKSLSNDALWGGLNLNLSVDVLSVAGETRQGSTIVSLCKKPLRLWLSVPDQQDRDRLKPITMELLSSTGRPTDGKVEWAIYPANEGKRTSDDAVMNGTLVTENQRIQFDINTIRSLDAGQYEFYAKGISGENVDSAKAYFLIFGMDDTKLPKVTRNWLYCPDATFNAEKPARVQIGSSLEDISFYYAIVADKQVVKEALIPISDELRVIEIPYKKSYGDGATFQYIFVKEGKVYRGEQTFRLEQPERTLKWEWKTFRDRLHPGDTETWTLSLKTPDDKPASAQVMATLYDASLDALWPHYWSLYVSRSYSITSLPWSFQEYYSQYGTSEYLKFPMKGYDVGQMEFDQFDSDWYSGFSFRYGHLLGGARGMVLESAMAPMATPMPEPRMVKKQMNDMAASDAAVAEVSEEAEETNTTAEGADEKTVGEAPATMRSNFNETAAFLPRLMTNSRGEVNLTFTLPESLTTWKMLGIAHTKDMMTTTFNGEVIASKEMMARLYLPRFLRADDQASVRAVVQNMTETEMSGNATLEIFDPETERIILSQKQAFTAKGNGECLLVFDYTPTDECPVVAVRLTADSKSFSDGEQHYLPILPSKTYVTESVEIRADSLGTFTTDLTSLFNKNNPTATNRRLTVEYTTHPIWHALQALPSLIEPQYDDIISLGTSLQAQSLSTYIANNTPRLKTLVEIWQREQAQGQPALSSRLAEDEELKQIILDETPWLREAENEADRKARLIELFNISRQETTLCNIAERMERRLEPDGGFSWFPGMESSEVMTRIVASELTRLRVMTNNFSTLPSQVKTSVDRMLSKNINFIAEKTAERIKKMKETEKEGYKVNTASMMYLEYVYTTQNAGVSLSSQQKADVKYILDHMKGSVADMNNWERAIAAVVMKGDGREKEARQYYESLLEHTTTTPDHGTFFDYVGGSFTPTSNKIIHHVAAMEAVHVMEPSNKKLQRDLRRWLLQQKRTQMWESNICTADAIYALVLGNTEELNASKPDNITLNYESRQVEISRKDADEAVSGLGFIKKQFADGEAPKTIIVERHTDSEAWGAVFATYLTPMTDATASATGLKVRRELNTTDATVGQRMTARYVITADRDYEFVCLRAARAACMEPAEQISGYRYQGGLGFYRAVRDAHTDYFFDRLPKGTYVLEETAFIDRDGRYTTGLTTIRCLYAPEYGGNTSALELNVAKEKR